MGQQIIAKRGIVVVLVLFLIGSFLSAEVHAFGSKRKPEERPEMSNQAPAQKKRPSASVERGSSVFKQTSRYSRYSNDSDIRKWCDEVRKAVNAYRWKVDPCRVDRFIKGGKSVQGRELVYLDFGNPRAENRTLVLSMVHGDEVTPLYVALKLIQWMQENEKDFRSHRVVIAPLVNPDGFLENLKPERMRVVWM